MKKNRSSCITLLLTAALMSGCMAVEPSPNETQAEEKQETAVLSAPSPKDDFYGYVNFDAIQNVEFEYGQTGGGSFYELQETVTEQQRGIIEKIGKSNEKFEPGSSEQLIHDYYQQVLSYNGGKNAMAQLLSDIERIRGAADITSLLQLWSEISTKYGSEFIPQTYITRDHKDPEAYAVYLLQITGACGSSFEDMMESDDACSQLWSYAEDMLLAIETETEAATEQSEEFVYLALELARSTDITVQYANDPYAACTFISEEQVAAMFPEVTIPLSQLLLKQDNPYGGYYVQDAAQLEALGKLLTDEYLDEWKIWAITGMIKSCGAFISEENQILETYFYIKNEEKRVESFFASALRQEIGELYAEQYYTDEMDAALKEMFEDLRGSYRTLISEADWLSEEARKALLKKLESIRLVCGGGVPRTVDASDAGLIGDDLFGTFINLNKKTSDDMLEQIGTPYDDNVMEMSPQTVNACYSNDNKVTITVAIMNDPFFSTENDYYENLGGLGAVVGHEIGHAFDSSCMNFDENGRYNPEWLPEADRKILSERADIVTEYFGSYTIMDVYHVDGELTNGENYADLGGVECVVNLTEGEENLKTLFESYARIWCNVTVDSDAISMLSLDVHSPEVIRVNAVLSSCDKFYETYDIKEGDGMYKAPEERVSRW